MRGCEGSRMTFPDDLGDARGPETGEEETLLVMCYFLIGFL